MKLHLPQVYVTFTLSSAVNSNLWSHDQYINLSSATTYVMQINDFRIKEWQRNY